LLSVRTAVLCAVILLSLLSCWAALRDAPGGDFQIYCAALRLADTGADPHDVDALARAGAPPGLPMTTPALALLPLRSGCAAGRYAPIWIAAALSAFLLVGLLDRRPQWLLLAAVIAAGFDAVRWMLVTGNIAIFEMLFAGTAFAALAAGRRLEIFVLALGAATFLKIEPVAFSVLAFVAGGLRRAVIATAGVFATFAAFHALGFLTLPAASSFYWKHLLSGFGGFFGAEAIYGGNTHPSMLSLFSDVSAALTGRSWPAIPFYVAIAGLVLADLFFSRRTTDQPKTIALWGLGLLLAMPRLKPYAFGLGIVPLYLAARQLAPRQQIVLVAISCAMPMAAAAALTSGLVSGGAARILGYYQLFALAGAYLLLRRRILHVWANKAGHQ
jgi:hypothetical protein